MIRNFEPEPVLPNETRLLSLDNLAVDEIWQEDLIDDTVIFSLETEYEGKRYRVSKKVSRYAITEFIDEKRLKEAMRYDLDIHVFGQDRFYEQGYRDGFNEQESYVPSTCADSYQQGLKDGQGDRTHYEKR